MRSVAKYRFYNIHSLPYRFKKETKIAREWLLQRFLNETGMLCTYAICLQH